MARLASRLAKLEGRGGDIRTMTDAALLAELVALLALAGEGHAAATGSTEMEPARPTSRRNGR